MFEQNTAVTSKIPWLVSQFSALTNSREKTKKKKMYDSRKKKKKAFHPLPIQVLVNIPDMTKLSVV